MPPHANTIPGTGASITGSGHASHGTGAARPITAANSGLRHAPAASSAAPHQRRTLQRPRKAAAPAAARHARAGHAAEPPPSPQPAAPKPDQDTPSTDPDKPRPDLASPTRTPARRRAAATAPPHTSGKGPRRRHPRGPHGLSRPSSSAATRGERVGEGDGGRPGNRLPCRPWRGATREKEADLLPL